MQIALWGKSPIINIKEYMNKTKGLEVKMQKQQTVRDESALKTDYLAWRIINAKKRQSETSRNRAYNMRPRLRSETHH